MLRLQKLMVQELKIVNESQTNEPSKNSTENDWLFPEDDFQKDDEGVMNEDKQPDKVFLPLPKFIRNIIPKKESFDEIFKEMSENIPDSTSTVQEKQAALGYIERILKSDATQEQKDYWQNKKLIIQNEIKAINSSQSGKPESFDAVWKEFIENVPDVTSTSIEKELALSYISRILNSDAPDDVKSYWKNKYEVIRNEMLACDSVESGKPESFDAVWKEFIENVPDVTSTVEEKELALSYISRILNSDASDNVKSYWNNKASQLVEEINNMQQ